MNRKQFLGKYHLPDDAFEQAGLEWKGLLEIFVESSALRPADPRLRRLIYLNFPTQWTSSGDSPRNLDATLINPQSDFSTTVRFQQPKPGEHFLASNKLRRLSTMGFRAVTGCTRGHARDSDVSGRLGRFLQLLEETEHLCGRGQQKVAKIVHCGEH